MGVGLHKAGIPLEAEKGQLILERAEGAGEQREGGCGDAGAGDRGAGERVVGSLCGDVVAAGCVAGTGRAGGGVSAVDSPTRRALAAEILKRWEGMSPQLKQAAAGVMVKRPASRHCWRRFKAVRCGAGDLSGSQAAAHAAELRTRP